MKRRDFLKGVVGLVLALPVLVLIKKAEEPPVESGGWSSSSVADPLGDIERFNERFNERLNYPPRHYNCRCATIPVIS